MNGLKVEIHHEPMNASNVLPNSKLNVSADEYFPVFELVYLVDVCLVINYRSRLRHAKANQTELSPVHWTPFTYLSVRWFILHVILEIDFVRPFGRRLSRSQ